MCQKDSIFLLWDIERDTSDHCIDLHVNSNVEILLRDEVTSCRKKKKSS